MTLISNSLRDLDKSITTYISDGSEAEIKGFTKEQILLKDLKSITQDLVVIEEQKKRFAKIIKKNMKYLDFSEFIEYPKYLIKESRIKRGVEASNIRGLNVVCVDGSSVVKNFMDIDFSFYKAIAVKYYFNKTHNAKIKYCPDLSGFNNYSIQGNYFNQEEQAVVAKTSIEMTFMEINLLNQMIETSDNIDFIIIDGSIVIMPINLIFVKNYEVAKRYDKLMQEYQRLYSNCRENKIILIGSIKDTRTSALTHLLKDSILYFKPNHSHLKDFLDINYRVIVDYFSDLDLFNRILNKSERSCIFQCKKEIEKIRDTGLKSKIPNYFPLEFYAFYLKSTLYDAPCRIEFFVDERHSFKEASQKADLIASILLPISSLNEYYGLPIPQIEAHKRAVFNPNEINLLFNSLTRTLHKNGINLMEKRRNRRPF
ncbi:MAG: DNA double-strand break repair nuclease NurA [Promethearchaeota archaeon]